MSGTGEINTCLKKRYLITIYRKNSQNNVNNFLIMLCFLFLVNILQYFNRSDTYFEIFTTYEKKALYLFQHTTAVLVVYLPKKIRWISGRG